MGVRTEADLITQILVNLDVVPEGQAAEQDDIARVQSNLQSIIDELAALELLYVPDLQNIPSEWFMSLADVCAYELRKVFGVTGEFAAELKLANDQAVGKIQTMTRGRPTYEPQRTLSF